MDTIKHLHMRIPSELHCMLMKMSIDTDISATNIIVKYLRYLQKKHYKERLPLDENSEENFNFTTCDT